MLKTKMGTDVQYYREGQKVKWWKDKEKTLSREKELQKLNILNCNKWEVDWQYKVSSFTQMYVK